MTFITVGAAVAFLSNRPLWQKIIITLSAIPIAIGCNVLRVTGQGFLDLWSHELSEGFAHQFAGIVMLVPAFFLILLVGWVLDQLFIEEVDEAPVVKPVAPRAAAAAAAPDVAAPSEPAVAAPAAVVAAARPKVVAAPAPATTPPTAPKPAAPKPVAPKAPSPALQATPKPAAPKPAAPKPATPPAAPAPAPKRELIIEIPGTANARAAQKRGKNP
jgi:exosortase/archaeosortase family protein